MLTWMINRQLDTLERRLGASVDYLRLMARTSRSALFKFFAFVPLAAHRGRTDRTMLFAARFQATKHEDCGTCVQIVVNQAERDGIPADMIQAVIDDDVSRLDRNTRLAIEFARAVLEDSADQDTLREELRSTMGERTLVDLSLAIATARVFPMLKRGLGFAVSCQQVVLRSSSN